MSFIEDIILTTRTEISLGKKEIAHCLIQLPSETIEAVTINELNIR